MTDFNILKHVERILVEDILNSDRDYNHFHPSEWDDCHRKLAYRYYESKGYIQVSKSAIKTDPQLQRIFDNGHFLHSRWRSYLERTGFLRGRWLCKNFMHHKSPRIFGEEEKLGILCPEVCECGSNRFKYCEIGFFNEETLWGGHVDAIIDISGGNSINEMDLIVVDFKSMNPYEFDRLIEPKPKHITQMQIYLYLSGLKFAKFLYENKANQSVKEFLVIRDDEFIKQKRDAAIQLKHIVEHTNSAGMRVLPPRAYEKKGETECLGCKYRDNCWNNGGSDA